MTLKAALIICGGFFVCTSALGQVVSPQPTGRTRQAPRPVPQQTQPNGAEGIENESPSLNEPSSRTKPRRARRTIPEYFYRPSGGKIAIEATGILPMGKTELSLDSVGKIADIEASGSSFDLRASYGISPLFAIGIGTGYGTSTLDIKSTNPSLPSNTSSKSSGMTDVRVFAGSTIPMGVMAISAELDFSFSPGNAKESSNTGEGNMYSGGHSVEPRFGAAFNLGSAGWLGAQIGYEYEMERTSDSSTGSSKITGGDSLTATAFYELRAGMIYVSPAIGFTQTGETKTTSGSGTSTSASSSSTFYGIRAGVIPAPGMRFLLQYAMTPRPEETRSSLKIAAYSIHALGASALFEF